MHFSLSRQKGIRIVIPGFINYGYRYGETVGHTKSALTNYKILTIHGIITKILIKFEITIQLYLTYSQHNF